MMSLKYSETSLYTIRFVGRPVRNNVWFITFFVMTFGQYCSCPIARDSSAVYPALFFLYPEFTIKPGLFGDQRVYLLEQDFRNSRVRSSESPLYFFCFQMWQFYLPYFVFMALLREEKIDTNGRNHHSLFPFKILFSISSFFMIFISSIWINYS